jgi:hypothetical protein
MKVLIIKAFQDTPTTVLYPYEVVNMWDTTAERAIKTGKAVPVPEGVDGEAFKQQYINELKNKKGK